MLKTKTQGKTPDKAIPGPIIQKQSEPPEKQSGPSQAARPTISALPPPNGNGAPPAARAGDLMTAPGNGTGTARRARMMTTMQRTVGTARLSRMLGTTVQTKLTVGAPNDLYEQEANRVADQMMRMPEPRMQRQVEPEQEREEETLQTKPLADRISPLVQRQVEPEEEEEEAIQAKSGSGQAMPLIQRQAEPEAEEEEETIQTKPNSAKATALVQRQVEEEEGQEPTLQTKGTSSQTPEVTPDVESYINTSKGGGEPLSESVRTFAEPRFGQDFGGVRVHAGARAARAARALNAQAFTSGEDIYFGGGRYQPGTPPTQRLLAHELTHVVQQGDDGRGAPTPAKTVQRQEGAGAPALATPAPTPGEDERAAAAPSAPTEPVSLEGATFSPPPAIEEYLGDRGTAEVPVRFGNLAAGNIRVRKRGENYDTVNRRNRVAHQAIDFQHPGLRPLRGARVQPVLVLRIRNNSISGYASVAKGDGFISRDTALINSIKRHKDALGWSGLDISEFPRTVNKLENGVLRLQVNDFKFKLGGFLNGVGSFGLENESVTFNANATVHVQGLTSKKLEVNRDAEGQLSGRVEVPVSIARFSGNVIANYTDGTVDIRGTVHYADEKFSGEITLLVTDAATARNVALEHLGPEAVQAAGEESGGRRGRRTRPGKRALAGWGVLDFAFTDWLSGKAMVIVDNEGHITVIGEITPQAEVELFAQRDYIYSIFELEVRARYGVPLVGSIFLFANIDMDALAKLGPGKIYNITVKGRYSTDPRVFNEFSIEGTLNISAFAGLRLRAEGGAGIELVGHDIKAGVGLNGLAGVRGYVEATPTIGYREKAAPEEGKAGEFYIKGHMELAAQPFLQLGGDLFVELDSPWWSPAPDKKWTWPLGQLEYPLPGEFGMGADVDYVIGSDKLPEIQFGEVDFNKDKFMSDLLKDKVPPKSKGEQQKQGVWKEGERTGEAAEPKQLDTQGAPPEELAQGRQEAGEGEAPKPNAQRRWLEGMQALGDLARRSRSDPFDQVEINEALARLRTQYGFSELRATRAGEDWRVFARMNPDNSKNPIVVEGAEPEADTAEAKALATPPCSVPSLSPGELVQIHTGRAWAVGDFQRFYTLHHTQLVEVKVGKSKLAKPVSAYCQDRGWKSYTSGATRLNYGSLDAQGRPAGIQATLGLPLPRGTRASYSPPGFEGEGAGHARGHLLGNQLGGSGSEPRNIVTLFQTPVNAPIMSGYESKVRQAVEGGQIVEYRVTPVYSGANPMPIAITMQATGDRGFSLSVSIPNRK